MLKPFIVFESDIVSTLILCMDQLAFERFPAYLLGSGKLLLFFTKVNAQNTCSNLSGVWNNIFAAHWSTRHFFLSLCPKLYLFAGSQQGIENTNPYHSFSLTSRFISVVSGGRTNISTCPFTVTNGTKTPPFYYKGAAYCRLQQVKKP